MKSKEQTMPRARREGLLVQELADELLVYDRTRHKAHCLNQTAGLIWKRCDGKTSASRLAHLLGKETNTQVDEILVLMAFDQLAKAHLLQGEAHKRVGQLGMSRRDVIRRLGTAAAVALPVVSSIVAPGAVQAATCLASGAACTSSAQCCSLLCSASVCA